MAKDSFILYTEQKEVIDKLSDEQAGKLIKAIYEYVETKEIPKLDTLLEIVIIPFKQNIDRNADKYEEIKKKRSLAGKVGAKVKKQKQAKQANANFAKQMVANQADNVNDNVNVNDNENVNVNVNDNNTVSDSCVDGLPKSDSCEDGLVVGESCEDGLQSIIDFYNENIGLITPYGLEVFTDYAKEMDKDLIILAMKKAVEANIKTIKYIKGILNNWSNKGIKTVLQAQQEDDEFKNKTMPKEETQEEAIARKTKALEEAIKNANK